MDIFSKILRIRLFFSRKLRFFANSDLEKYGYPAKSLVQRPGQTQRPTTIIIGMHFSEGLFHGLIFENLENSNLFPRKLRFFLRIRTWKNYGYPTQSLLQRPRQTQWPATIKIGMHLPEGLPYGNIFEKFVNSNFYPPKIAVFCELELRKITATHQKVWYNALAKPNGLQREKLVCTFLKGFPVDIFSKILKISIFSPENCVFLRIQT